MATFKHLVLSTSLYRAYRRKRMARALREWNSEDQDRLAFFQQFVRAGDLVFDVGANVGNRSKVFLRLGARVVAFEPQESCANLLESVLGENGNFRLVKKALGRKPGTAEMMIGDSDVLSTLSKSWVDSARESGRFKEEEWVGRQQVAITTLDDAIAEFGCPAFSKIDVEGFESEVIAGVSGPLPSGSIEFAAEFLDATIDCLRRLASIQECRFQFSSGESMRLDWQDWQSLDDAVATLKALSKGDSLAWGDVYFLSTPR